MGNYAFGQNLYAVKALVAKVWARLLNENMINITNTLSLNGSQMTRTLRDGKTISVARPNQALRNPLTLGRGGMSI